jgi:hypothetical protein
MNARSLADRVVPSAAQDSPKASQSGSGARTTCLLSHLSTLSTVALRLDVGTVYRLAIDYC